MALERVKAYFVERGAPWLCDRVRVHANSTATVELAAQQFCCSPAHIAKSISFCIKPPLTAAENRRLQKSKMQQQKQQQQQQQQQQPESPTTQASSDGDDADAASSNVVIVVTAGDARLSAKLARAQFACKPRLLKPDELERATGFVVGGVCPFALPERVRVYLDTSLRRFTTVYPACGTPYSGVPLSLDELERYAHHFAGWIDVCEGWPRDATCDESNNNNNGNKAELQQQQQQAVVSDDKDTGKENVCEGKSSGGNDADGDADATHDKEKATATVAAA